MNDYLKSLSRQQLEHLIKKGVDQYLGEDLIYTVKDLNTPNVNSKGDKLTFRVEILDSEHMVH